MKMPIPPCKRQRPRFAPINGTQSLSARRPRTISSARCLYRIKATLASTTTISVRITSPQNWPNNSGHITAGSRYLSRLFDRPHGSSGVPDEERLWLDGERYLSLAARVLPLYDLQGPLVTLGQYCYPVTGSTSAYFDRDPYHLRAPFCL